MDNKNSQIFKINKYPFKNDISLIEASAGTGKTFSLVHLVIRLILEKQIPIKKILVVSFTRATASEIKSLILKRIIICLKYLNNCDDQKQQKGIDEPLYELIKENVNNNEKKINWINLLNEALIDIENADITTIHGFCSRTLKREAINYGSVIEAEIETENSQAIRETINDYWINNILEIESKHLEGIIKSGINIESIENNLIKIDNQSSLNIEMNNILNNDIKSHKINYTLNEYIKDEWFKFCRLWNEEATNLEDDLCNLAYFLKEKGITDTKPYSIKPRLNRLELMDKWINNYNINKNIKYPSYTDIINQKKLLKDYYHPANINRLRKKYLINLFPKFEYKVLKSIYNLYEIPKYIIWAHSLYFTKEVLRKKRRISGKLNNSELLSIIDPLKNDINKNSSIQSSHNMDNLYNNLKKRYKVALIDEFQDTDPVQWRILNKAFGNSHYHSLILIGDPKQSIYKFRGGDLKTYLIAKDNAERKYSLRVNYRSSKELINSLNKLYINGLTKSKLTVPKLTASTKNNSKQDINKSIELFYVDKHNGTEMKNDLFSKDEFEKVIIDITINKVISIKQNDKTINFSDICILVNNHTQANQLRLSFSESGLPCRLVPQGDIFKTEAAWLIQKFINCVAFPKEINNIKVLICTSLFKSKIDKISLCKDNIFIEKNIKKFTEYSQNFQKHGLNSIFFDFLNEEILAEIEKEGMLIGDLYQCIEKVQEESFKEGLDAQQAARWLKVQRLGSDLLKNEENKPNSDIKENSINLITVHRSKGLQFKIVIYPYFWQSPSLNKGPLWKNKENTFWKISNDINYGIGEKLYEEDKNESICEAERLTYVALTRSENKLIIYWGKVSKQEDSPSINLIFGPSEVKAKIEELSFEKIEGWLKESKIPIFLQRINSISKKSKYIPILKKENLVLGKIPTHKIESDWARHSYSSWVSTKKDRQNNKYDLGNEIPLDEILQEDDNQITQVEGNYPKKNEFNSWEEDSPLRKFPRGAEAGNCIHRILEKINFNDAISSKNSEGIIEDELLISNIDIEYKKQIKESLYRTLNTDIGISKNLNLKNIQSSERLHELKFDIPITRDSKLIKSIDIFNAFIKEEDNLITSKYVNRILELDIESKGFLNGSIDLVIADNKDHVNAKWWVIDWKTNWIGLESAEESQCGPHFYSDHAMQEQMKEHHYELQAHIYLLALHRLLKWRLPNYSLEKNLGGYIYIFLRGLPSQKLINKNINRKIPGIFIRKTPIKRLIAFDNLFYCNN